MSRLSPTRCRHSMRCCGSPPVDMEIKRVLHPWGALHRTEKTGAEKDTDGVGPDGVPGNSPGAGARGTRDAPCSRSRTAACCQDRHDQDRHGQEIRAGATPSPGAVPPVRMALDLVLVSPAIRLSPSSPPLNRRPARKCDTRLGITSLTVHAAGSDPGRRVANEMVEFIKDEDLPTPDMNSRPGLPVTSRGYARLSPTRYRHSIGCCGHRLSARNSSAPINFARPYGNPG
jgi:hypothetical protein